MKKKTLYFEVACEGRVVYLALATTAQAKIKAAAVKALKERGWAGMKAEDLTIRTPRGMSIVAFAKNWLQQFLDLDETIDILLRDEDDLDPEDRPGRLSPVRFRAEIPGWTEMLSGEAEDEWVYSMRLLGKDTPERKAFNNAFDKITGKHIANRVAARLPVLVREMLPDDYPAGVVDDLCKRYWVHPTTARRIVEAEVRAKTVAADESRMGLS